MLIDKIKNIVAQVIFFPKLYYIQKKFNYLKGKTIFIFGSSPKANFKEFKEEYLVISCNASAKNIKNFNLPKPALTLIDNELIDEDIIAEKKTRSTIIENEMLKNLDLGDLISVQSNHSSNSDKNLLKANINSYYFIPKRVRKIILDKISKQNFLDSNLKTIISTGIFAAYLCFFCKAKKVFLCGFSLHFDDENKKWFYRIDGEKESSQNVRNHSLADCLAVGFLAINGYDIISCEKDFLPVTKNWEN